MTASADVQRDGASPTARAVRIVVGVALLVIVVGVGIFLVDVRTDTATITPTDKTSDADYCLLAKSLPFVQVVDGVAKKPDYLSTALATLPKSGPEPVNDEVAKLRQQLSDADYTGATATAKALDEQTANVCP